MKKLSFILICLLIPMIGMAGITEKKKKSKPLPEPTVLFLQKYFNGNEVIEYKKDGRKEFTLLLSDSTKLSFTKKGDFLSVKCKKSTVPTAMIPEQIITQLKEKYKDQQLSIVYYSKSEYLYSIRLSNYDMFLFDKAFKIKTSGHMTITIADSNKKTKYSLESEKKE